MSPTIVYPITRQGGWEWSGSYRSQAHRCLANLEDLAPKIARRFTETRRLIPREQYTALRAERDDMYIWSNGCVVFSAMAVESFLNHYGVVRLGEEFFADHYERLSARSKVAALVGTCCQSLLTRKDSLLDVVKRIAGRRNDLVHPKTTEAKPTRSSKRLPKLEAPLGVARAAIRDLERFIKLFREFDTDGGRWEHV